MGGEVLGDDAVFEAFVDAVELRLAGDAQQVGVTHVIVAAGHSADLKRSGHSISSGGSARNSGPGNWPLRADAGFSDRFFAGQERDALGNLRRGM